MRKIVGFTHSLYSHLTREIQLKYVQDKWKRKAPVWNDEVWNDPMSMVAGAFHTKYPDVTEYDLTIDNINKTSVVIGETTALADSATVWTTLQFGPEFLHEFRKKLI